MLIEKLKQLGYTNIQILCHPAYFENVDVKEADWYCVMAKKEAEWS